MIRFLFPGYPGGRPGIGLLLLRLMVGTAFIFHGWPKIQNPFHWMGADSPLPGFIQALPACAEFCGGIALIVGLLTPIAPLGIAGTMVVALAMVHLPKGDPFVATQPGQGSFEPAAGYLVIMI